ncbi:MAG: DUF2281 domain-containing protein [Synechococcales bacterium]|nr:DUF2281 domain-containing protein [Synechococcales bacterium]
MSNQSMSIEQFVTGKLHLLPPEKQQEVLDFVEFLEQQILQETQEKLQPCRLSESSLQKDWLRTEEEMAWQDL